MHIHLLHTRPRSIISSESTSSPHFITLTNYVKTIPLIHFLNNICIYIHNNRYINYMINFYISMKFIYLSRSGVMMEKVSFTLFFDTPMYFVDIKRIIIYSSFNLHLLNSHPLILGHSSQSCSWFVCPSISVCSTGSSVTRKRFCFVTDEERLPCDHIFIIVSRGSPSI